MDLTMRLNGIYEADNFSAAQEESTAAVVNPTTPFAMGIQNTRSEKWT